jgi:small subunit ribosomal protein S3
MLGRYFIKQGIKEATIENFIRSKFPMGDYSKVELQRTPLGLKVLIWTNKPGKIIGKGGRTINEMTDALKAEFGLENLQLDAKLIEKPDLDPRIVAKQIASALEKGYNFKKIGNLSLKRILRAGAVGAEIVIAGRVGGGKAMRGKFIEGYLKHCGQPAKELVDEGFEEANTRPGKIGIRVRIMRQFIEVTGERRKTKEELEQEKGEKMKELMEKKEKEEKEKKPKKAAPRKKKEPAEEKPKARKAPAKKAEKKAAEKKPKATKGKK